MCNLPDWISALASAGTLIVAALALGAWREQLRGTSKHAAAIELATEAKALRYLFFESRSPLFEAWEFPPSYYEKPGDQRTAADEADAWRHVYANRWKEIWPQILKLAHLRPKIGATLGDDVAAIAEDLARKAREVRYWWDHDLEMKRVGPQVVAQWADQAFVKRTRESIVVSEARDDKLSKEFTEILNKLLEKLKPSL